MADDDEAFAEADEEHYRFNLDRYEAALRVQLTALFSGESESVHPERVTVNAEPTGEGLHQLSRTQVHANIREYVEAITDDPVLRVAIAHEALTLAGEFHEWHNG